MSAPRPPALHFPKPAESWTQVSSELAASTTGLSIATKNISPTGGGGGTVTPGSPRASAGKKSCFADAPTPEAATATPTSVRSGEPIALAPLSEPLGTAKIVESAPAAAAATASEPVHRLCVFVDGSAEGELAFKSALEWLERWRIARAYHAQRKRPAYSSGGWLESVIEAGDANKRDAVPLTGKVRVRCFFVRLICVCLCGARKAVHY